jgi:O-antigen/teichoic acid export membrane protein
MTAGDRDRLPATTSRSALKSLGWNYGGSVAAVLLQLGYTAYTGRTVTPDSFGAYAIALTMTQLLGYFCNAGLSTCLLRTERLTLPTVRAAQRLGTASGVVCFALVEMAAPVCGVLWKMPELTPFMQVVGCQFLVQPGASVAVAALRRVGRPRMAIGVTLLLCGWVPFGLAAALPAAAATTLIVGTVRAAFARLPPGPPVRARDLLASSGFLTGFSLMQFATYSTPLWVAGRLLGPGAAGAYSRASLLTGLPVTFLTQGLSRAATPMLAERRAQRLSLNRAVEHAMCTASAVAFISFGAVAGIGPAALGVLLGPGWGTAAALVPMLAVGSALALLCSIGCSVDQVRHAPRALLGTQLTVVATTVAGIAATAHSLPLMASAAAAGQAAGHIVQLIRWHRIGLLPAATAARTHLIHIAVGATLGGAAALGSLGRPPGAALACGLAAMLPVIVVCGLLRTRLPLYEVAVASGLLQPRRNHPGRIGSVRTDGDAEAQRPGRETASAAPARGARGGPAGKSPGSVRGR